ncbi:hypothetical protein ACFFRR_001870 [Megaselia abdita]
MFHRIKLIFVIVFIWQTPSTESTFWTNSLVELFRFLQESIMVDRMESAQPREEVQFICKNRKLKTALSLPSLVNTTTTSHNKWLDIIPSLPLKFFIHGWKDYGSNNWVEQLQDEWIKFQNITLCVVDWGALSLKDYKSATLNVFDVGSTVAGLIESLERMDERFNRTQVTIAGYSLGAHAAGYAGQLLNGELGEIIGLDAAGPLFTIPADVGDTFRLDKGDARFVQVMHTSMGTLGTHMKSGHADFYPNGGVSPQSNCVLTSATENPRNSECFHYGDFSFHSPFIHRCCCLQSFISHTVFQAIIQS